MGNLHEGHLNLLKIAKNKEHFSLVSIFVNPLQFSGKKKIMTIILGLLIMI